MRILFAGTPAVAVPGLDALVQAGHEIALVLTRPDAPLGRKRVLTASPVAARAEQLGLPVLRSARIDAPATEAIAAAAPELGVVIAYGGLVPPAALAVPPRGWLNLHFSLLPAWRGAAPVQRAIMAGEAEGGVSVFRLVRELDAGPLLATAPYRFGTEQTAGEALEALAGLGARVLTDTVAALAAGTAREREQEGEPSYAAKLSAEDGRIDWGADSRAVDALIRGVTPEPGAFTELRGARVKVLRARRAAAGSPDPSAAPGTLLPAGGRILVACGAGAVELLQVQPAGRTPMRAADWARGLPGGGAGALLG